MLQIAQIKKSAYYKWKKTINERIEKEKKDAEIVEAIKQLYEKHKGRLRRRKNDS